MKIYLGVLAIYFAMVVFFPEQIDGLFLLTTVALLGSMWLLKRTRHGS